ncbi:hypothetical protein CYMTET_6996 [Cymbomonas tetramitiformis]|uniref:Uncharacterized protein n=1 Tax=Cymbomonas tetramitiformis TaxID=36881 RepID=A0AAE0GVX1_9CHLO|nr:hypothetical protein CYMTET_6996 [Cymbomonas tetramitiformis]
MDREDMFEKLLSRLDKIEAFIKTQRMGGGVDISAYGFTVVESDDSEDEGMDVQEELRLLRTQIARVHVRTEEFPGGVELVPVRHAVPSVSLGAPISAVACSLGPSEESFAELGEKSGSLPIDDLFMDSEE